MFNTNSPPSSKKRKRESDSVDEENGGKNFKRNKMIQESIEDEKDIKYEKYNHSANPNLSDNSILINSMQSEIFKSNLKNSFLNCIWRIKLSRNFFASNFRKVEKFYARPGFECSLLLDYCVDKSEISFAMQIGKGEEIEKYFLGEKFIIDDKFEANIFQQGKMFKPNFINDNNQKNDNGYNEIIENKNKLYDYFPNNSDKIISNCDANNSTPSSPSMIFNEAKDGKIENGYNWDTPNDYARAVNFNENESLNLMKNLEPIIRIQQNFQNNVEQRNNNENNIEKMYSKKVIINIDGNNKNQANEENSKNNLNKSNGSEVEDTKINLKTNNLTPIIECKEYFTVNSNLQIVDKKSINFLTKLGVGEIKINTFKISNELINYIYRSEITLISEINVAISGLEIKEFIGLINEGNTCYMNSILQTLNILGYFKKAVFKIPLNYNENNYRTSVAYSLQKLFYEMMTESKPMSKMGLIKSFGWGKEELLVQHDVHEFNLVLSEHMENKMKGTPVEGTFKFLFEGKLENYIQCIDVDYRSVKEETFHDLQLNVKGCNNIYESFDNYTDEEILDRDNQYDAEGLGKQDAKKGLKFLKFPNVLIIQLKRFEYNFIKNMMEKVNDYFEFYEEIDLNKYLIKNENDQGGEDNLYSLHSVIIHSGSPNAGHYFAYIKPYVSSEWLKFNDESVKHAVNYEVFQNNFGGAYKIFRHDKGNIIENEIKSDSNAYILVYIKNKERDNILSKTSVNDVSENLKNLFEKDKQLERIQIQKVLRQRNNMNINIFSKETLQDYKSLGMRYSFNNVDPLNFNNYGIFSENRICINIPKEMSFKELIGFISYITNIPTKKIKLFKFSYLFPITIIKRFSYHMTHIDDNLLNRKIHELNDIPPNKNIFLLYIHIVNEENENYSLLRLNQEYEGSLIKNDEIENEICFDLSSHSNIITNQDLFHESKIYFHKLNNKWMFNVNGILKNGNYLMNFDDVANDSNCVTNREDNAGNEYELELNNSRYVLCIMKFLKLKVNESMYSEDSHFELVVDNIFALRHNQSLENLLDKFNFREIYKKYLGEENILIIPNNAKVVFQVENFSLEKHFEKKNISYFTSTCKTDLPVEGFKNDAVCLIIDLQWSEKIKVFNREISSFTSIISEVTSELESTVVVPFYLNLDKKNEIQIPLLKGKKQLIKLTNNQNKIKENILLILKSHESILNDVFNIENLQYYILDKNMNIFSIKEYIKNLTINNIELDSKCGEKDREGLHLINEFPLLEYLLKKYNTTQYSIFFSINFISEEFRKNLLFINILLYDINNNPLIKLGVCLPRCIDKCSGVIDHLNENQILSKFYHNYVINSLEEENNLITKNNFFFIIQNPNTRICYDLFDNDSNLRIYEGHNAIIEYRLQPYSIEEISNINNRIFISVADKENNIKSDPFIIFIDIEKNTVGQLKEFLLEKLKKIKALSSFEESGEFNNLNRIKFYNSYLQNFKPIKDKLIPSAKDQILITNMFNQFNAPCNILIELPSHNQNVGMTINC